MTAQKVTPAQRLVLENIAAGRDPFGHITGRAAYGGAESTRSSLLRRDLMRYVDHELILTDTGRAALRAGHQLRVVEDDEQPQAVWRCSCGEDGTWVRADSHGAAYRAAVTGHAAHVAQMVTA